MTKRHVFTAVSVVLSTVLFPSLCTAAALVADAVPGRAPSEIGLGELFLRATPDLSKDYARGKLFVDADYLGVKHCPLTGTLLAARWNETTLALDLAKPAPVIGHFLLKAFKEARNAQSATESTWLVRSLFGAFATSI
jgi:hypothetical protein